MIALVSCKICWGFFRISRSWVSIINKSQKILGALVGALMGALLLDLRNRECQAPMAPTLKFPLLCDLFSRSFDRSPIRRWVLESIIFEEIL